MTPERMARLVAAWVRFYTRRQPPAVAQRRAEEIDADLHDHIAHERARGTSERRIALSIAGRMARGMAADASARRPLVRVALATAIVLLVPLIAMQFSDGVAWSPADFVAAGVLVAGTGLLLEAAARRPRSLAYRAAAIAIGVAACLFGSADDAPGLVLFGCLLIAGTVALTVRATRVSRR
jgi:hypothetical protein